MTRSACDRPNEDDDDEQSKSHENKAINFIAIRDAKEQPTHRTVTAQLKVS